MVKNFTSEHLILHLYNELNAVEKAELEEALLHDSELAAEYAHLLDAKNLLSKLRFEGPESLIDRIIHEAEGMEMA